MTKPAADNGERPAEGDWPSGPAALVLGTTEMGCDYVWHVRHRAAMLATHPATAPQCLPSEGSAVHAEQVCVPTASARLEHDQNKNVIRSEEYSERYTSTSQQS